MACGGGNMEPGGEKMTHLSLFTGIGGLDLAAEWAGFETVGQCEWADYPTQVLERHWPDVPRWRDIRTLTGDDFYEKTGLRTVDVISGGFPCQPHSCIGKKLAEKDERHLWPEFMRVIRELRPRAVVGENVAGILSTIHDSVCTDLEEAGYETRTFCIPAYAVGAHHERYRVAIIGISKGEPGYETDQKPFSDGDWGGHGLALPASIGDICPECIGQRINPRFSEWLMGYPEGWTDA